MFGYGIQIPPSPFLTFIPLSPEPTEFMATWIRAYLPLRRTKVRCSINVPNGPILLHEFPLEDLSSPRVSVRPSEKVSTSLRTNFRGLGLCQSHRALCHGGGLELWGWPPCSLPPPTSSPAGYQHENRKAGSAINKT